jgi:hypothetical protein
MVLCQFGAENPTWERVETVFVHQQTMAVGERSGAADATRASEPASASQQLHWATSEDWGRHRDVIVALYKDGNKTLKDVAQHMEATYQFHATFVHL